MCAKFRARHCTSNLKNILTPFIYELNHLTFILNCRTTVNNDLRKNSFPKDTRKRGNIVSVYLIFHRIVQLFQNDLNILKILAHF
jgi:hypothetical protein